MCQLQAAAVYTQCGLTWHIGYVFGADRSPVGRTDDVPMPADRNITSPLA